MQILQTSELKQRTGEILDAARRQPQFICRDGHLFLLIGMTLGCLSAEDLRKLDSPQPAAQRPA